MITGKIFEYLKDFWINGNDLSRQLMRSLSAAQQWLFFFFCIDDCYICQIYTHVLYSVYFILGFSFLKGEIEELVLDFLKPFRQFHSMCNSFCQLLRPSYGT
jgi:hypothetical protein